MSQSHFNYMNGVPVKIAENYKPPKKLALNQSVAQRLTNSSQVTTQTLADCNYDFTLERTVLAKMAEWQQLRQHEIADRKERLRVHQQDRQKQLEAKQKQMLTAVSYPSTDDLSSTDDDGDDSGHGTLSDASKSAISMKTSATAVPIQSNAVLRNQQQQFSPPNNFDSILVPTVMPDQNYKPNALKTPSYTKINYSDFENDTSSPFDNCELKTINDLDILAEVLNRTVSVNKDDAKNTEKSADTKPDKQKKNSTIQANKEVQQQQQQQAPQSVYQNVYQNQEQATHQQYNHSRASMIQNSANPINSYYVHQMNYDHQANATQPNYYSAAMNSNLPYAGVPNQYVPNNYYNSNYTQSLAMSMHAPNAIRPTLAAIANATSYDDNTVITANSNIQTKAKWKSVPDIMQEINDEITNSEGKRVRNNSQSESKELATTAATLTNSNRSNNLGLKPSKVPDKNLIYRNLSPSSQSLATNISSMGFPLERVARITEKLGKDDKKIIEHLIPLGELLDLGFDEHKISEALLKFDNNKEKALDFLIS